MARPSSQKTSPYYQACSHLATARRLIGNITPRKLLLLSFCTCKAAMQHRTSSNNRSSPRTVKLIAPAVSYLTAGFFLASAGFSSLFPFWLKPEGRLVALRHVSCNYWVSALALQRRSIRLRYIKALPRFLSKSSSCLSLECWGFSFRLFESDISLLQNLDLR